MQYIVSYRYRFPLLPSVSADVSLVIGQPSFLLGVSFCLSFLEISCCVASRCVCSRKEVFQPHLPVRLPCYDLAPVIGFTLGRSLRLHTLGTPNFHGLTGGVYKARERIHRVIADTRLLANPTSRGRVADPDPNCDQLLEIGILLPGSCPLY